MVVLTNFSLKKKNLTVKKWKKYFNSFFEMSTNIIILQCLHVGITQWGNSKILFGNYHAIDSLSDIPQILLADFFLNLLTPFYIFFVIFIKENIIYVSGYCQRRTTGTVTV